MDAFLHNHLFLVKLIPIRGMTIESEGGMRRETRINPFDSHDDFDLFQISLRTISANFCSRYVWPLIHALGDHFDLLREAILSCRSNRSIFAYLRRNISINRLNKYTSPLGHCQRAWVYRPFGIHRTTIYSASCCCFRIVSMFLIRVFVCVCLCVENN